MLVRGAALPRTFWGTAPDTVVKTRLLSLLLRIHRLPHYLRGVRHKVLETDYVFYFLSI